MAIFMNAVIGIVQLLAAIPFAVIVMYSGYYTFSKLTGGFDASGEIRRGNIAVGILVASIFVGISIAVEAGVKGILTSLSDIIAVGVVTPVFSLILLAAVIELALGILLAIGAIYGLMYVIARSIPTADVLREIKYGNCAVAFVVASMILAVSAIIHYGVVGIAGALL